MTHTHYLLSTSDVAKLKDAYQQVLLRMEFPPAEIDTALAILAALRAEPDVEPVATMHESPDAVWFTKGRDDDEYACEVVHTFCYTAPQSAVPLTLDQIKEMSEEIWARNLTTSTCAKSSSPEPLKPRTASHNQRQAIL